MTTRIGYSDDETFPGQFALWQANCQRSLASKRGQASLRALEAALVALPDKRLVAYALEDETGAVCAIGALVKHQHVDVSGLDPEYEMEAVGERCGMPRLVAWKVVEENDVTLGESDWRHEVTPEVRYERMLAWVRRQLRG